MTAARVGEAPVLTPLPAVDEVRVLAGGELAAFKRISALDPYLSGHYPGRPVYPEVFVIESVLQAARRFLGAPALRLAELGSVRLQAPLLPGDTLRMSLNFSPLWSMDAGYAVRARCSRADGRAAASVRLRCAELDGRFRPVGGARGTGEPAAGHEAPADVLDLLPHRPPMLLIDRVVEAAVSRWIATEYTVRADEPGTRHPPSEWDRAAGAYPDTLVIESFVQSCAALILLGRRSWAGGPAGTVALGSARGLRLHDPVFPGQTMRHLARLDLLSADRALLSGASSVAGRACLTVDSLVLTGGSFGM